jgi:nucleoside-diphosphate-sugar epimerase
LRRIKKSLNKEEGMSTDVLVTGGVGFIGSFIVDKLIEKGYKVKIFGNLDPQVHPGSHLPNYLNREPEFIQTDIRDYEKLARAAKEQSLFFRMLPEVKKNLISLPVERLFLQWN